MGKLPERDGPGRALPGRRGVKKDVRAGLRMGMGGIGRWPGVTLVGERIMAKRTKETWL